MTQPEIKTDSFISNRTRLTQAFCNPFQWSEAHSSRLTASLLFSVFDWTASERWQETGSAGPGSCSWDTALPTELLDPLVYFWEVIVGLLPSWLLYAPSLRHEKVRLSAILQHQHWVWVSLCDRTQRQTIYMLSLGVSQSEEWSCSVVWCYVSRYLQMYLSHKMYSTNRLALWGVIHSESLNVV